MDSSREASWRELLPCEMTKRGWMSCVHKEHKTRIKSVVGS